MHGGAFDMPDPSAPTTDQPLPTTPDDRTPLPVTAAFRDHIIRLDKTELMLLLRDGDLNRNQSDAVQLQLALHGCIVADQHSLLLRLHNLLGHIPLVDVLAIARRYGLRVGRNAAILCDICQRVKQRRRPVARQSDKRPYAPLSAWAVDIWGPSETYSTFGHTRYIFAAVCKATRVALVFPLASTSQTAVSSVIDDFATHLRHLIRHAESLDLNIEMGQTIQADSASVFTSPATRRMLQRHGLRVSYTSPPYTQAKNGTVERLFATVINSARCMLLARTLPAGLLPEAVVYAGLVYNLTPHSALDGLSPMEALTGTAPDLSRLHSFGADAWVHQDTRAKAAPKGRPGKWVGIDLLSGSNIIVLNTPHGRATKVVSHHVTIDDSVPPLVLDGQIPTLHQRLAHSDAPTVQLATAHIAPSSIHTSDITDVVHAARTEKIHYSERAALNSPDGHLFVGALEAEVGGLQRMGCLVPIDESELTEEELRGATPCTTLFYTKKNADGETVGKCRLCFQGSRQQRGVDYDLKSNHTPRWTSVRIHLALQPTALIEDEVLTHTDLAKFFAQALNHTPTGKRVVAKLPVHARLDVDGRKYTHVIVARALYGQVNAGLLAERKLWGHLEATGWTRAYDPACWCRSQSRIVIWVDDILFRGPQQDNALFLSELGGAFPGAKSQACSFFLGHHISRAYDGSITIRSDQYINDIVRRFAIQHTKDTPLTPGCNPAKDTSDPNPDITQIYQEIVGCISHLAATVRPDIAFAASALGQSNHAPNDKQLHEARRTLEYLNGTSNRAIIYGRPADPVVTNVPSCYVDASYADAPGFRSQTGYIIVMNGSAVAWASSAQPFVATSSQEAEIVAAAEATKEIAFIRAFLESISCDTWRCEISKSNPVVCYEDNLGAINWFENGLLGSRAKHYGVRLYYVREQMAALNIVWRHIRTNEQIADLLTKSLASAKQRQHTDKLIVQCYIDHVKLILQACRSPWWDSPD